MKKLIFITSVLLSINAKALLRDCPTDTSARWHNCFGNYSHPEGMKYIGEYQDDKMHGRGTYTFSNGDKFVGEYKDNKKHGQGIYFWADGNVERGYYINDEYVPDLCKDTGLTESTEAFDDCILKLIDKVSQ